MGRKICREDGRRNLRKKGTSQEQYREEKCAERLQDGRMCGQKEIESNTKRKTWNRRRER
jgi:hypothetical protein